jgi:hypothetical protein
MPKVNPIRLQKFLGGVEYPASKDTLVEHARRRGADAVVEEALKGLPDQRYQAPTEVSRAIRTHQ